MHHVYSVLIAAAILYVAPIIANPLSMERHQGGNSVHFKSVGEGVWPYQMDRAEQLEGAHKAVISTVSEHKGHWI